MIKSIKTLTLAQIEQLPLTYQTAVAPEHLDIMGHMNVRHYLAFFDWATWQLFSLFGMDAAYYRDSGYGSFALQHFLHYQAEVRLGEEVAIYSRIHGRNETRLHLSHFMVNKTGQKLAAVGEMLGAHASLATRRMAPLPGHIAAQLDPLIAQHKQLPWASPLCGAIHL